MSIDTSCQKCHLFLHRELKIEGLKQQKQGGLDYGT